MCIDNKDFHLLLLDVKGIKNDINNIYRQFKQLNGTVSKHSKSIRAIQDKSLAIREVCPYKDDIAAIKEKEFTRNIIQKHNERRVKKTQYFIYVILSIFTITNLIITLLQ